jgi:hypothetical protein
VTRVGPIQRFNGLIRGLGFGVTGARKFRPGAEPGAKGSMAAQGRGGAWPQGSAKVYKGVQWTRGLMMLWGRSDQAFWAASGFCFSLGGRVATN